MRLPEYTTADERMLRSHLSLVHGTYVNDVKTVERLVECHKAQHADPDYHFMMRHDHDAPPVVEEFEEWTGW